MITTVLGRKSVARELQYLDMVLVNLSFLICAFQNFLGPKRWIKAPLAHPDSTVVQGNKF